eukprot:8375217-Pyramimonas_sp.AAC.1
MCVVCCHYRAGPAGADGGDEAQHGVPGGGGGPDAHAEAAGGRAEQHAGRPLQRPHGAAPQGDPGARPPRAGGEQAGQGD